MNMNMENQRSPLLGVSFAYYCQGKSVEEELRSSLWYTKLELEQTRVAVQDELKKKDDQIFYLKDLVEKTMKERDEAHEKYQSLLLDKLLVLQQQVGPTPILSGISSVEPNDNGISSSDCEDSIVSSSPAENHHQTPAIDEKGLPEKGKLLQAVMKAGPLLQTLLLAGPLPQWRHPPPPLDSFQIPPVSIPSSPFLHRQETFDVTDNGNTCGRVNRKRVLLLSQDEASPTASENKYQRIVLNCSESDSAFF